MLIRTAQRLPGARSAKPVGGDFQSVRLCDIRRLLPERTYSPQPGCKLAFHARIALTSRKLVRRLHLTEDALSIACKPRRLGANRSERADALQLLYRAGERPRFFEGRARIGVAAPNSQVPEGSQRRDAGERCGPRMPQPGFCIFTRSVPVALLEPHARTVREQVEPQEIQVVLFAVRQARAHMTGRLVVLTARNGHGSQARIGARHFLLKTAGQRELQTPLEIGPT